MPTSLPVILDPDTLQTCLHNHTKIHIIDVRAKNDFLISHIMGAVHFDIALANRSQPPISGLLPDAASFEKAVSQIGITHETPVVVVDESAGPPASRLAWTLSAFGHQQISILNGGMRAWLAEARPYTQGDSYPAVGNFKSNTNQQAIADANYIKSKLGDSDTLLLDSRSSAEFHGEDVRSKQGGHIPGAVNLNWAETKAVDNSGYFKADLELRALLTQHGITPEKEIISYCQTHQRSALAWVVLKHLGYKNNKGYPGAWSDWGNNDSLPVEK